MNYTIEIATSNYTSTAAAVEGGAGRIELCAALAEGGLTPSSAYLTKCRKDFSIPLFPIIRPRGGDFLYTDEEFEIIKQDVIFCREIGFDGIVTGFLLRDGSIDKERILTIVELAHPMVVTFHRAFDRCKNPFEALEDIINAGCKRILTSGQKPTAPKGIELINQLVTAADNRIVIMPGSGVRKENIAVLAEQTGAREFHSSLRSTGRSSMEFIHPEFKNEPGDYSQDIVSREEVQLLINALK
ncbi:copper homeostasis protein CutC [Segetibacter aerophilus]|uniref:PF03932 family protein CutC n=1 Tax=Segetibacter aerophilus TaxID=670293 RepID=A0A512BE29_9BACT|nr:copper homeostasis protein CutC [Segetibacter aerophilus]GEO10194.1 copper homeostasis protein CutC [Segetibacter aerophilus]